MTDQDPDESRFLHDCDDCIYILSAVYNNRRADIYRCPQMGIPTWVIRHGNSGPEYYSVPEIAALTMPDKVHPLAALLKLVVRAYQLGRSVGISETAN